VVLVVGDATKGSGIYNSVSALQIRLLDFPPDLEKSFEHLINSAHPAYKRHAALAFKVVSIAEEPLPLVLYSFLDDMEDDSLILVQLLVQELTKELSSSGKIKCAIILMDA
jgi:hypothetical protein